MFVQTQGHPGAVVPVLEYFVDRTCLPSWRLGRSVLWFHDLTWVQSGRAVYWCDGQAVEVSTGDLLYLPRGTTREAVTHPAEPMHCLACNFQLLSFDGATVSLDLPRVVPLGPANSHPDLAELYRRLDQAWLERDAGPSLEVQGLLSLVLHRVLALSRSTGTEALGTGRLALVRRYVAEHLTQPLTVGELARLFGLHPGYLGSWFRSQTGQTVHGYINRLRIRRAEDLLSTGGFSVTEVAEKCGFSDVFYFSKVFRRLTGRSPSDLLG